MPELKRKGRATIQDEFLGDTRKFRPEPSLRWRQYLEVRDEFAWCAHAPGVV